MGLGNIKKCRECKELFSPRRKEKICSKCKAKEDQKYKLVKDYLWDYPGATIGELHEETGVEKDLIRKFVKEGRFVKIKGMNLKIDCERCGAKIKSGRFCQSCKDNLRSDFEKAKSSLSKKEREEIKKDDNKDDNKGMHLGDRHRRK